MFLVSLGQPISEAEGTGSSGIPGGEPAARSMTLDGRGLESDMRRDGRYYKGAQCQV